MLNATALTSIRIVVPVPGLEITVPYLPRVDLDMMVRCTNPDHDHTSMVDRDGMDATEPLPMICNGCELPSHWDEGIQSYVHDDVDAPECWLMAMSFGDPLGDRSECTF